LLEILFVLGGVIWSWKNGILPVVKKELAVKVLMVSGLTV